MFPVPTPHTKKKATCKIPKKCGETCCIANVIPTLQVCDITDHLVIYVLCSGSIGMTHCMVCHWRCARMTMTSVSMNHLAMWRSRPATAIGCHLACRIVLHWGTARWHALLAVGKFPARWRFWYSNNDVGICRTYTNHYWINIDCKPKNQKTVIKATCLTCKLTVKLPTGFDKFVTHEPAKFDSWQWHRKNSKLITHGQGLESLLYVTLKHHQTSWINMNIWGQWCEPSYSVILTTPVIFSLESLPNPLNNKQIHYNLFQLNKKGTPDRDTQTSRKSKTCSRSWSSTWAPTKTTLWHSIMLIGL